MSVKFTDLQCKEVICVSDGRRLGFISDIQVTVPEYCHYLPMSGLGNLRACCLPWMW